MSIAVLVTILLAPSLVVLVAGIVRAAFRISQERRAVGSRPPGARASRRARTWRPEINRPT